MKNPKDGFLKGRLRSLQFALRGLWILISSEDSIKAQLIFAAIAIALGFIFDISTTEWALQFIIIGLVLVAEAANSAVEEVADFIHPDFHEKIGKIKDIGAAAPTIAAIISLIVAGIIYIPKILLLF